MYIDRFNEREEEAEKEPAAQEPSLLMQGEEVHEPAIALMVNGTRRRSRKRTRMPLCSLQCHARFLATAPTQFLVYLSPVKNHGCWQVRCGNIDYFGPSHKPYTVYCNR